MARAFDIGFRIFSTLLGLILIAMGVIWILQGLNLAFNGPMAGGQRSFMVGDPRWIAAGSRPGGVECPPALSLVSPLPEGEVERRILPRLRGRGPATS